MLRKASSQSGSSDDLRAYLTERLRHGAVTDPRLSPSSRGGDGPSGITAARLAAVMNLSSRNFASDLPTPAAHVNLTANDIAADYRSSKNYEAGREKGSLAYNRSKLLWSSSLRMGSKLPRSYRIVRIPFFLPMFLSSTRTSWVEGRGMDATEPTCTVVLQTLWHTG